ncbi:MAG: 2-enoate reductase, partial [Oscillospiraceae bacterium]|nr:2-enoate reductase [Oscillospiraceae bacterium]
HKVPVYLHSTITEIGAGYCLIKTPHGRFKQECDAVINGIGFVPAPVGAKAPHVHRVGDCVAIGNLRTVIWRAWDVCMRI